MIQQLPLPLVYPSKPVEETKSVPRRRAEKQAEEGKAKLMNRIKQTQERKNDRPNAV